MGLIAKDSGGDFKLIDAGTYPARCLWVIDLGKQHNKVHGGTSHKVFINWEVFPDEGDPQLIGNNYTLSLNEKAHLRKHLVSWRGRDFTEEEMQGFDITNLIGVGCMLTVVHNKQGDKTYANVAGVAKPPKGFVVPEATQAPLVFLLHEPDWDAFDNLSEGMQKWIQRCEEWPDVNASRNYQHPLDAPAEDLDDDEVPF